MCHEASGRAMTAALGTGKGTVDLRDWTAADAIWLMGDNAATNAPRMLTWLAEAERRGAQLDPHQSADRSSIAANDRTARARRYGHVPHDQDWDDERAGADRRRHGATARRRQSGIRGGRERSGRVGPRLHRRATRRGFDEYRAGGGVHVVVRPGRGLRGYGVGHTETRRLVPGIEAGDRRVVSRPHAARDTASIRCARSSTCCCCAATSASKARVRARFAATATCRATGRAASTIVRTAAFLDRARRRSAGSIRRASMGWARWRRSRPCSGAT